MSRNHPTTGEAVEWLERQGEAHFGSTARVYRQAVERFSSVRVEGEPDTVTWVLEHLDTLAERVARRDHVKPTSLRTYVSRARNALTSYQSWCADPTGWSPAKAKAASKKDRSRKAKKESNSGSGNGGVAPTPPGEESPPDVERSLEEEISLALQAAAGWPKLRPYLMEGLAKAMEAGTKKPK